MSDNLDFVLGNFKKNPRDNNGDNRKTVMKMITNNLTLIAGSFLIYVAIAVFFTDIKLNEFKAVAALSLDFSVFWFCSFLMYTMGADSGVKKGGFKRYISTR